MTQSLRQSGVLPLHESTEPDAALPSSAPPPNITDYDPMRMPVWTLLMALAWIATRDAERVTWQRDEWRRANGLPEGSILAVSIGAMEGLEDGDDEDEDDPTVFRALDAFDKLKAAGEGDEIEVYAMALGRNEPVTLRPLDWTYGKLSFDSRYDEVWRVGGEYYHTMTVGRENLLRVFPAPEPVSPLSDASRDHEVGTGPQGLGQTVQVLADAIWYTWQKVPDGFPRREDRFKAIWDAAKGRQPALRDRNMPSFDSFERAEKAVKEHLKKDGR
ncbi:hypothetical protein NIM87_05790 [Devosia sp. XJ19-1]|uniref:Uncharacterized protein n=1 Tax=Devosia ureilytica TaxID=2952754 RepID=A0A9Q4FS99_9HYPH|nr:hypothetical protein [Devosia ureilytica]MCP8883003.1 hypothetical protein [Devosia ureilytica]MCP8886629.1 hypothetical protein [Devosia ureilytica]